MSGAQITLFRKRNGILSKHISLRDGKANVDNKHCYMKKGEARRVELNGIASLGRLLESMRSHEALALGRLRSHLPDRVRIVTKDNVDDETADDVVARSGAYLHFAPNQPAYMLLDHDRKGTPREVAGKLAAAGGFWSALVQVIPALAGAAYVQRASTSAWLFNRDTREWLPGSKGEHIYIQVADGSDIERATKTLHQRLWLAGFGYHVVGTIGQLLSRSIIDAAVWGAERLVFEGQAELVPPVAQSARKRLPLVHDGVVIDSAVVIADLTADERAQLDALQAASATRLKGLAGARRQEWARAFAERRGLSVQQAVRIAARAAQYILDIEFELEFDDPALGRCTVGAVVSDPSKYVGETLADPLEGVGYGRGKAKVFVRDDHCLMVHSFAHGGINYQLGGQGVRLEDFRAYKPQHNFIYTPTSAPWPAVSVDASIPPVKLVDRDGEPVLDAKGKQVSLAASRWLDQYQSVEQMTWAPGQPMLVEDWLMTEDGWERRNGTTTLNLFRPSKIKLGDAAAAGPWVDHINRVYPEEAQHIIAWLAQRVQQPDVKVNHALLLGGNQGIGKDTLLEPVKETVGASNFHEVSPRQVMGRFNAFLKSVILRVSEARDLDEHDRFAFYDHLKTYTVTPPNGLRVDEKNLREYTILNCCGLVITSNHRDGVYLPADDRRVFVAWSELSKEDFDQDYWRDLWGWYGDGGNEHVAAYLSEYDLSDFDPKAPPPRTAAFRAIVNAGQAPEQAELADVLDGLNNPPAVTLNYIAAAVESGTEFRQWLEDRKNRRIIPHRLEACGYERVTNPDAVSDGLWKLSGRRVAIYVHKDKSGAERVEAARQLVAEHEEEQRMRRR